MEKTIDFALNVIKTVLIMLALLIVTTTIIAHTGEKVAVYTIQDGEKIIAAYVDEDVAHNWTP